jgi:hypothetical protein
MGWWMYIYDRWQREQAFFKRFPGVQMVKYEPGPRWARALFNPRDVNYLCRPQEIVVNYVAFQNDDDRTLFKSMVNRLPPVREARIKGPKPNNTLEALGNMHELQVLTFENYDFTEGGLPHLEQLPALKEFRINGHFCRINDEGVQSLCKIKSLRKLSLFCCPVTDSAIDTILQAPWLEELDFGGCMNLSEEALLRLTEMPNLKAIFLNKRPQITSETRNALKQRIPTVVTE